MVLPHILFFVLLSHGNIPAIGFELVLRELPKGVMLHAERVIEHSRDVVLSADRAGVNVSLCSCRGGDTWPESVCEGLLQYPDEALVQLGVCALQVAQLDGFA